MLDWIAIALLVLAPVHPTLFVYDLTQPAMVVPTEFGRTAPTVIECESKWDTNAVGRAGELGIIQIHPQHAPRMASLGLDFHIERDRMEFAIIKWEESGWEPWSCKP